MFGKPVSDAIINDLKENPACCKRTRFAVAYYEDGGYLNSIIKEASRIGATVDLWRIRSQEQYNEFVFRCIDGDIPYIVLDPFPFEQSSQNTYLDLDAMDSHALYALYNGDNSVLPPTSAAVIELLKYYIGLHNLAGKFVTVVGRGYKTGRPLVFALNNLDACVTLCNSKAERDELELCLSRSDVVISCTGDPDALAGWVSRPNQVLVDVGWTMVNGEPLGDFDKVTTDYSYAHTPVPGGVGSVTAACLVRKAVHFHSEF